MREWWLRTVLVLQAPRAVFAALRDDSSEPAANRSEPVLLIVLLAGVALALWSRAASHLLDNGDYDGLLIAVWSFLAGGITGIAAYWAFGAILFGAGRAFGSRGSYRRARHVLAFASVPLALSLALWPVRLALYGEKAFRAGGVHAGHGVFSALWFLCAAWGAALLVVGVRTVHGWTWPRSGAAAVVPLAAAALLLTI